MGAIGRGERRPDFVLRRAQAGRGMGLARRGGWRRGGRGNGVLGAAHGGGGEGEAAKPARYRSRGRDCPGKLRRECCSAPGVSRARGGTRRSRGCPAWRLGKQRLRRGVRRRGGWFFVIVFLHFLNVCQLAGGTAAGMLLRAGRWPGAGRYAPVAGLPGGEGDGTAEPARLRLAGRAGKRPGRRGAWRGPGSWPGKWGKSETGEKKREGKARERCFSRLARRGGRFRSFGARHEFWAAARGGNAGTFTRRTRLIDGGRRFPGNCGTEARTICA
jgi:hypothetical protein